MPNPRVVLVEFMAMEQPIDHYVFVLSLRCLECNRRWDDENERWRVYFTGDEPPKPVTYCPDCARREFDD